MAEHLSDEWLDAAATRFEAIRLDPPAPPPGLLVDVSVGDADGGTDIRFSLVVRDEQVRLVRSDTTGGDAATVRLRTDREVARRIATGELSAQRAFMAGSLQLGGDVTALVAHRELLSAVGDVLADLRPNA